jgi:hypothetical protein
VSVGTEAFDWEHEVFVSDAGDRVVEVVRLAGLHRPMETSHGLVELELGVDG